MNKRTVYEVEGDLKTHRPLLYSRALKDTPFSNVQLEGNWI